MGRRLQHSDNILQRVSELLAEREKVHGQATAAAIERVASVISGTEKVGKINTLASGNGYLMAKIAIPRLELAAGMLGNSGRTATTEAASEGKRQLRRPAVIP